MNKSLNTLSVVALSVLVGACAAPRSPDQLASKTIHYQCGPGGQQPLAVQYTFQGDEPASARVIYQNQVVMLPRVTLSNADLVGNTFRSENYTWITQQFDYQTVGTARGEMLTRDIVASEADSAVPGSTDQTPVTPVEEVSDLVVSDCVPVVARP